jgi:catechol 2,3-dioxygenase-like lactoylglutathione lyase family enzyme
MSRELIRKVDCVSLPVADLDAALAFYRDELGHALIWRSDTAAGLRLPDTDAELVVHTEPRPPAAELLVESVPRAVERFVAAGGTVHAGPFPIPIGECAVVGDPFGNVLVMLDQSRGLLQTDAEGKVTGVGERKAVYVLVGPKGAGKSYLGRLAEKQLGLAFVDVEALALSMPEDERRSDLIYARLERLVDERLRDAPDVILEVTGASPHTGAFFESLRRKYQVRLVQLVAPPDTCLARIEARGPANQLPATPEQVREINRLSLEADFEYDLRLGNPPTDESLLSAIARLRDSRAPRDTGSN